MSGFTTDDIRAAVAANILTEAQAASLLALGQKRLDTRSHLPLDDEPFEFFRGFSEIFVTTGLALLFSGLMALSVIFQSALITLAIGAILCVALAFYYTLKRRMSLPSISLSLGFGVFFAAFFTNLFSDLTGADPTAFHILLMCLIGMAAMLMYFKIFKLPFSMFVFGIFGMAAVYAGISMSGDEIRWWDFPEALFDLNRGGFALGSLIVGIVLFITGLYFDTKDPNRLTRFSATGFWLHIIAAPAIVNTAALSLMNTGGNLGLLLTTILLLLITLLSLIIDRRSFLTAGILYFGFIIGWVFTQGMDEGFGVVSTLLLLGIFITSLGTWWVQIRARLMQALPNFPYKDRLPPYSEPS